MGDHAVLALVGAARRHHDHFALGLGQVAGLVHQGIVIGKECAEFIRAVGEGEEYVGNEAGLFLDGNDAVANVLGHVLQFGDRETADCDFIFLCHAFSFQW